MTILVCGGRDYQDRVRLFWELGHLEDVSLVIAGGATGADALAVEWAEQNTIPTRVFKPDWKQHGRAAGPIRNQRMLDEGKPDLVVAFPGGRGTDDMVNRARTAGIKVLDLRSLI